MPPAIEKHILEELHRYDPLLRVRWRPFHPMTRRVLERWQISRLDKRGVEQHIMFVVNKDGSYRPVDQRVLRRLAECDLWRYASIEQAMSALELPADALEQQRLLEAHGKIYNHRYHDWVEEMADRIGHAVKDDPHAVSNDRKMYVAERVAHQEAEASEAFLRGKGIVELDPEVGGMRMQKGSE